MGVKQNLKMEQPMSSIRQASEIEWKELLTKSVATGAIAALASMLLFENESIPVTGIKLPGSVAIGLGAAAGSLSADLAHKYIMPHIPANKKYEKAEFAAISVAASGLGTFAVSNLIGSALMAPTFAIGAGSYISGDYIYHNFIDQENRWFLVLKQCLAADQPKNFIFFLFSDCSANNLRFASDLTILDMQMACIQCVYINLEGA
jgi:hypothetical protein